MTLEIVVDELIVRGLSPEQARVLSQAFEVRLTTFASEDAELRPRAEAFRKLPEVEAHTPAALGEAVATGVWSALT